MQTFYFLYKITNTVNNKIYLGKHKTTNLDDGYFGSGKLLKRAISKHGKENFIFEVLEQFNSEEELNQAEKELITEEFCKRDDNYNLCVGGKGGFSYINRKGLNTGGEKRNKANSLSKKGKQFSDKAKTALQKRRNQGPNKGYWGQGDKKLIAHTKETKEKISLALKEISKGERNSQYGSMWITNGFINKKQKTVEQIPEGWYKGRKITSRNNSAAALS